ncbi:MAG: hypothetical protein ACRBDL_11815 [Alphaproteobacteria bacterium]
MPYTFNQAYVPITTDVLDALPHSLSVDSYNRGYRAGIVFGDIDGLAVIQL